MNPTGPTLLPPPAVIADWAETLTVETRKALDRMDTTLTLAEAKVALMRRLLARRRAIEPK